MANVICPQCGESYHETTDAYRPGVITTGNMQRLKKQYALNGWPSFPEHEGMRLGDLFCPGCGGMYSDNGMVRVDMAQWEKDSQIIEMIKTAEAKMRSDAARFVYRYFDKNIEMDALMAEYDPEPPEYSLEIEKEFLDCFKNGIYHKDGPFDENGKRVRRKPGRQKR